MRKLLLLLIMTVAFSCTDQKIFTQEDREAVDQIRRDYVNGWLANDSETVLGLFENDATIVPSGLAPIMGIKEIENYWFPNDSSETIIHTYSVELIDIQGVDSMAFTLEKGLLNFTYTKGDFSMSKESISHATTVYRKNKEGKWKIFSRIWTSLNK